MTSYYVSSSAGNDSNSGTSTGSPWRTITHAIAASAHLDTLNLYGPDTFAAEPAWPIAMTVGGRTFQSYGGTGGVKATVAPNPTGNNIAFLFTNCNGVSLINLALVGPTTTTTGADFADRLVMFKFPDQASHSNFTIRGCDFSHSLGGSTFQPNWTPPVGFTVASNISITGNTYTNSSCRPGPEFAGNTPMWGNFSIIGNTITDGTGYGPTSTYGIAVEGGKTGVISGNVIRRIGSTWTPGNPAANGPKGIELYGCSDVTVSGNVIDQIFGVGGGRSQIASGIGVDQQNTNITITGNILTNLNGVAFNWVKQSSGITFAENLVVNYSLDPLSSTSTGAMWVLDASLGTAGTGYIYNNTIITSTSGVIPALYVDSGCATNLKIANNILTSRSGRSCANIPTPGSGFDLQQNGYLSGPSAFKCTCNGVDYFTLANWRTATGMEGSGHGFALGISPFASTAAPSTFGAAWANRLASTGSPLYHAGLDVASLYGVTIPTGDLLGYAVPVPYSVGCINPVTRVFMGGGGFSDGGGSNRRAG